MHEVYGAGATGFAAVIAQALIAQVCTAPVLWVREGWQGDRLHPGGLSAFLDPARLLVARTASQTDSLAVAEEALKDGALALVVMEITAPLDLREGRRLQLAARAGQTTGLCLIPEGMGSNAAETRWRAAPVFDPAQDPQREDSTLMQWEIIKNKSGTLGVWNVRWDPQARRLGLVAQAGL
jgi:protein ImuA